MTSPFLTAFDLHLLAEGKHYRSYDRLGAHSAEGAGGASFAVLAPNASRVSVIGDFNGWNESANPMEFRGDSGAWECFVPGVSQGANYKYRVASRTDGSVRDKRDPYAFALEPRPGGASTVWSLTGYEWGDAEWIEARTHRTAHDAPVSIYEVHPESWMRVPEEGDRCLDYRELGAKLADYVRHMGFTHVQFTSLLECEEGRGPLGLFALNSRLGRPQDFMNLVDALHRGGIGVLMDWTPARFPSDEAGLDCFDGTNLYERPDEPSAFDFSKPQVRNLLTAAALFWLDKFHIDGLHVSAATSALYLDHGEPDGRPRLNAFGGREDIGGVEFLRTLNERAYGDFPGVTMTAQEWSDWPLVSRPTYLGGLGFGFKWNSRWTNSALEFMGHDPIHRSYHHDRLLETLLYSFSENFVLALSHEQSAEGRPSLYARMPGDEWRKFANLRLLYGYMFAHPGKKLLFMGDEFGQCTPWDPSRSLDWRLAEWPDHAGLQRWIRDLNTLYRGEQALYELDADPSGFEWIDNSDRARSVISFLRRGRDPSDIFVFVCNFTPVPRTNYRIGVPSAGFWEERLNSDAVLYGGSGQGNIGGANASPIGAHGRSHSLNITLPPLGVLGFRKPR